MSVHYKREGLCLRDLIDHTSPLAIYEYLEPRDILSLLQCSSSFNHWLLDHHGRLVLPSLRISNKLPITSAIVNLNIVRRVSTVPRLCNQERLLGLFGPLGPSVRSLNLDHLALKGLTVSGLAYVLSCCPSLESLRLAGISFPLEDGTFEELSRSIRQLSTLKELVVSGCGHQVNLKSILTKAPNLKCLDITGCAPVPSLSALQSLEHLNYHISGTATNEEYLEPIKKVLPNLKSLSLDASRITSPTVLERLATHDVACPTLPLESLELKATSVTLSQEDFGPALGRLVSGLACLKSLSFNWAFVVPGISSLDSMLDNMGQLAGVKELSIDCQSTTTRLLEFITRFTALERLSITGPITSLSLEQRSVAGGWRSHVKSLTIVDTSPSTLLCPDNLEPLLRLCPFVETLKLSRGCGVTPNDVTAVSRVCRETLHSLRTVEIRKAKLGMPSSGPMLVDSIVGLMPPSVQSVTLFYTDISVPGYRSVKGLQGRGPNVQSKNDGCDSPRFAEVSRGSAGTRGRSATMSANIDGVEALNVSLGRSVEFVISLVDEPTPGTVEGSILYGQLRRIDDVVQS
ncbi:hypothetical protein FOL47_008000 [Perkinsus chesapeaki]|uniref:Uncharacterized protein n=1 Tax=Perkinsus chesapeaki TaxID=330153 RepID=A0A7J6LGG6_PERCH|nr:hypothetical protein FOL47_008000 [Perkinsus chesapeaki]